MALVKYPLRITLSSFAPVLSEYKNLPFLSQRAPTWKHLLPFRSFFIAELSDGVGMGNQLSTWNLSIQSAVDGENFNYNPDYNQVSLFLSSYLVSNLFSEHSLPACSLQPKGAVLIQASMARLHFLLRLLTYSPTTLGSTSGSERPQAKQIIWIFKIFLWILVDWGQNGNQLFAQVLPCFWSWPTFALAASTSELLACYRGSKWKWKWLQGLILFFQ